jgi:hypothetical protein
MALVSVVDILTAQDKARTGDLDGAIELSRAVIDDLPLRDSRGRRVRR